MSQNLYLQQADNNNNILYSDTEDGTYNTINNWPYSLLANNVFFKSSKITISQNTVGANETYGCTGANIFFVCAKDDITIGNTSIQTNVTIDGITGYLGLIQNGAFTRDIQPNGGVTGVCSNIAIKNINIGVTSNSNLGVTLNNDGGGGAWLCQPFFGYTASIQVPTSSINNCNCNALVSTTNVNYLNGLGGFVGNSSSVRATNCKFSNNIFNMGSGGIFGANSYYSFAENCVSGFTGPTNELYENCGGIFGAQSRGCTGYNCKNYMQIGGEAKGGIFGSNSSDSFAYKCSNYSNITALGFSVGGIFSSSASHCIASNCFNYGTIDVNGSPAHSGGIFGGFANRCSAYNCFNIGDIKTITSTENGNGCGGIFGGGNQPNSTQNCIAYNCYNLGSVVKQGGGIFGSGCTGSTASFCYNTGSIDSTSGGIFGSSAALCIANNCYSVGTAQNNSGAIFSSDANICTANYCYSINNVAIFGPNSNNSTSPHSIVSRDGWVDTAAQSVLSYGSNGDWTSVYPGTPFLLSSFNNNFYNNINYASIEQGATTNLTLSQSGNYFFIFSGNDSDSVSISNNYLELGQLSSSHPDTYELGLLRTYFYNPPGTPTLQDSAYMYGYNIINLFALIVNQSPLIPSNFFGSSAGYDILKHFVNKNQQKYVKKNIAHLLKYS